MPTLLEETVLSQAVTCIEATGRPQRNREITPARASKFWNGLKMTSKDLLKIAKHLGIAPNGLSKAELIRSIQRHEGNFECFGYAWEGTCAQTNCLWRIDCLKPPIRQAE